MVQSDPSVKRLCDWSRVSYLELRISAVGVADEVVYASHGVISKHFHTATIHIIHISGNRHLLCGNSRSGNRLFDFCILSSEGALDNHPY